MYTYTYVNIPLYVTLQLAVLSPTFPKKSFLSRPVAESCMWMLNLESCTSSDWMVTLPREGPGRVCGGGGGGGGGVGCAGCERGV